jgi:hypothetical protein
MNKFRLVAPALALFALFLSATPSRADLQLALSEDGGAMTVVATLGGGPGGSTSFTGSFGPGSGGTDFTVTLLGGSSSNGASLSDLLSSTVRVTNNTGAQHTLQLWVTQSGYTLPAGTPLSVESGMGGSVNVGTVGLTGIFQGYADKNNGLFGITDFTNGPQNATQTGSTLDTGSATGSFNRTAGQPYSLTIVSTLVMSGGGQLNYAAHINVHSAAIPAPAGLVLAASGAVALALARLRRRKVQES